MFPCSLIAILRFGSGNAPSQASLLEIDGPSIIAALLPCDLSQITDNCFRPILARPSPCPTGSWQGNAHHRYHLPQDLRSEQRHHQTVVLPTSLSNHAPRRLRSSSSPRITSYSVFTMTRCPLTGVWRDTKIRFCYWRWTTSANEEQAAWL